MRTQLAKGLKINAAKKYVAEKLGVTVKELSDSVVMAEIREKFGLGCIQPTSDTPIAMEAKMRIANVLDIPINSVERFKENAGIKTEG